jgi:beta-lactamase regulating signal transducer with metallopeptidase domain/TolA-binding protein
MNIESPVFIFLCKWTVLLALGWTAHGLLRSRDARWRLILWRSVLCFGLALPLLQFFPMPAVQVPVNKVAQMVSETITLPAPALPASAPAASHLAPLTSDVQNPSLIHAMYDQVAGFFPTLSWSDILIAIWIVGALCGAVRLLRFLDQLAALRRAAVPASPAVQELTAEVLRRWQISGSVLVLVSDSAVSPFAFGIFRPAIMLPAKMAQSLSSEEMAALLGHEVAHLRRCDLWWCVGWRWMKAIFWFHPLIWKLPDVHSLACEEEADRLASSYLTSRASYARLLAQLTLRVLAIPQVETQLAVNGTAQITHRLHRLQKDWGPWNRKQTVAACLLVLAMALVSMGCNVKRSADPRLEKKVEYSTKQASVQDIVQSLAEQVGLRYDWQKSFDQTHPLCLQWVWNVTIDGKTCQEALEQILKPVGLRYQVENGVLVLSRQGEGMQNAPQGASRQLAPEQQQGLKRMQSYRGKYAQRQALDVSTHTEAKVVEVENAYQAALSNFCSPECIEAHKKFIEKYPGFNRTGCALSELAGMSEFTSPETEQYYKECIQKYDDCYWGDGVQVGPFARFGLANYYKNTEQNDKAEALYTEIKDNYPDSIDHSGQLLVDCINKQ